MLLAWIHSHVQSVPCNFSSVDVHTQHSFAKVYDGILGLVIELKENGQLGQHDFFEMSQQGAKLVENCSRKKNCNTREQHQSCNNPSIYKSAIEKVMFHNDTLLEVRNFMRGSIEFENELLNIKMERQQGPRSIPSKSPNDQNTPLNTEATSSFGASKSSSP